MNILTKKKLAEMIVEKRLWNADDRKMTAIFYVGFFTVMGLLLIMAYVGGEFWKMFSMVAAATAMVSLFMLLPNIQISPHNNEVKRIGQRIEAGDFYIECVKVIRRGSSSKDVECERFGTIQAETVSDFGLAEPGDEMYVIMIDGVPFTAMLEKRYEWAPELQVLIR